MKAPRHPAELHDLKCNAVIRSQTCQRRVCHCGYDLSNQKRHGQRALQRRSGVLQYLRLTLIAERLICLTSAYAVIDQRENYMTYALEGVMVLDLSRVLAGPYCAMMLADMGADVLKIEEPEGGDESRTWPPFMAGEASGYLSMNRNKRNLTLNLKTPEAQNILKKLVARADVLIENFRTGTMEAFGLGYDVLQTINPRLIYCAVSVFGRSGPYKDKAGYEALMQAFSGVMSITGEPDGPPLRCGVSIMDLGTGMMAAYGVMNALFHRERTGIGQKVEVSLFETALSLMSYHAVGYLLAGNVPQRQGSGHPMIVPYQVFPTHDGEIFIVGSNQRLWTRLCQALHREDLLQDPRFGSNAERVKHRHILVPILQTETQKYPTTQLNEMLDKGGIPCAPVNTLDKVLTDPQTLAREMVVDVPHPLIPDLKLLGIPIKLSDTPGDVRLAPPIKGQHTENVLTDLGYSEADIRTLRGRQVI
jgi:crotonobetainyl-CoA:carnitine CoA-transferase CaiB-like acyl-CoA transferase